MYTLVARTEGDYGGGEKRGAVVLGYGHLDDLLHWQQHLKGGLAASAASTIQARS